MSKPSPSDCDPDDDPLCPMCNGVLQIGRKAAKCLDKQCGWDYCDEPEEPDFIHV